MCSNDPFENTLTAPKRNIFSIDNRAAEYARLMGASKEAMCVDKEENEESILKVDRYLSDSVDRHHLASDSWGSEKVPKVELKQLPARLKYTFLYDTSYPVIVNANLTSGELTLLLNKLRKYRKALGILSMTFTESRLIYACIGYTWKTSQNHLFSIRED